MKTYKNLYSKICTWETLEIAYRRARKGKRGSQPVADFTTDWQETADQADSLLRVVSLAEARWLSCQQV